MLRLWYLAMFITITVIHCDGDPNDGVQFVNRSTTELTQALENITASLSHHNSVSPSATSASLTTAERVRLIRMVQKVVHLANEVLGLNYTVTGKTGHTVSRRKVDRNPLVTFSSVMPVDLIRPCSNSRNGPDFFIENYYNNANDDDQSTSFDSSSNSLAGVNFEMQPDEMQSFRAFSRGQRQRSLSKNQKLKIGFDLLQDMIFRANHLKGLVTDIIKKNMIKDCLRFQVPHIFRIPFQTFRPNEDISEMLSDVYRSLANQTAHLYFVWTEQKRLANKNYQECKFLIRRHLVPSSSSSATMAAATESQTKSLVGKTSFKSNTATGVVETATEIPDNKTSSATATPISSAIFRMADLKSHLHLISNDFLLVSNSLRHLMCYLSRSISLFDIPVATEQIVQDVLGHSIDTDGSFLSSCYRRSIFECQMMRTASLFVSDIENFLRQQSNRFLTYSSNSNQSGIKSF